MNEDNAALRRFNLICSRICDVMRTKLNVRIFYDLERNGSPNSWRNASRIELDTLFGLFHVEEKRKYYIQSLGLF